MADDVAVVAYAWVIDGISTIFVTDEVLDTAWAVAQSFVDTHVGLEPPDSLAHAVDLRSLWYGDTSARLVVHDHSQLTQRTDHRQQPLLLLSLDAFYPLDSGQLVLHRLWDAGRIQTNRQYLLPPLTGQR